MKSDTENRYFPVFLDISKKNFLVVGGGKVAERKVRTLLKFKAKVKVVSPELNKGLKSLAEKGMIRVEEKEYETRDLEDADLVISATNNRNLNWRISSDAKKMGIYANVVDDPDSCDFIMPSIVKKGSIVIAISTSAKLPFLSKKLRKELEKMLNRDYTRYVSKISKLREELKKKVKEKKTREQILKMISSFGVSELAKMNLKKIREIIAGQKK